MSRAEQLAGFGAATAFRTSEHQPNTAEKKGSSVFSLYNVLQNQVPLLFDRYKQRPLKERNTLIRQDLAKLLYADYASFLKEELGFTLYANVLDVAIGENGVIFANDVRYADSGLAEQCARAVRQAAKEGDWDRVRRYKLEEEQTIALLSRVEKEFQQLRESFPHAFLQLLSQKEELDNTLPKPWKKVEASEIPSALQERLSGSTVSSDSIFRGKSFSYLLPQSKVYPRGDAFWGRWTLWAAQLSDKPTLFFIVNEQFMNSYTYEEHALAQEIAAEPNNANPPPSQSTTESVLMRQVAEVNPSLASLSFQDYIQTITKKVQTDLDLLYFLGKQQKAAGVFSERNKLLWETSETIADILLQEHSQGERSDTKDVLNFVNEVPMHSLISGGSFSSEAVHRAYQDIQKHRSSKTKAKTISVLRDSFLKNVALDMPQLNHSVLSQVDCAVGSFGGIAEKMQALQSAQAIRSGIPIFQSTNEALNHFRSTAFTRQQLEALVGKTRAKEWKVGKCVGCGASTMVGECSLCYACELESENIKLPESTSLPQKEDLFNNEPREAPYYSSEKRSVGQFFFALLSPTNSIWN